MSDGMEEVARELCIELYNTAITGTAEMNMLLAVPIVARALLAERERGAKIADEEAWERVELADTEKTYLKKMAASSQAHACRGVAAAIRKGEA